MKTGIFGGTFNPPHLGHISAAAAAAEQLGLDKLYFIPTAVPPHKSLPDDSAGGEERMEMLRLACRELEYAEVLDIELRRPGPSYTADTVEALKEREPDAELWLLCGRDMFVTLRQWYRAESILENADIAVFSRAEDEMEKLRDEAAVFAAETGKRAEVIVSSPTVISSTELRDLLKEGRGGEYIGDEEYAYILKNRLYGVRPEPDKLWKLALPWIKRERTEHVAGCRRTAARLARRWGADVLDAENAAILHDLTKGMSPNEQLIMCERYGRIVRNPGEEYAQVLHAFTGAELASALFGVSDEVSSAIRWHTTGKADMTLLEKIIWLADYIEPGRRFAGVEEVRRLAVTDLDGAMRQALKMSLEHLREKGTKPYGATVEALAFLENRGE